MEKINKWVEQLYVLNEISAKIEPQAAYNCFMSVYKHNFNYYMRTISDIGKLLRNVDEIILTEFIPAIADEIFITENAKKLLSLVPQLRGLGLVFEELCEIEYQNSIMISEYLCNHIADQFRRHQPDPELDTKKKQIRSINSVRQKKILEIIRNKMSSEERKQNDSNLETTASSCLTIVPVKEEGYVPNKQSFWDLLSIRYGWRLKQIPSQ